MKKITEMLRALQTEKAWELLDNSALAILNSKNLIFAMTLLVRYYYLLPLTFEESDDQ